MVLKTIKTFLPACQSDPSNLIWRVKQLIFQYKFPDNGGTIDTIWKCHGENYDLESIYSVSNRPKIFRYFACFQNGYRSLHGNVKNLLRSFLLTELLSKSVSYRNSFHKVKIVIANDRRMNRRYFSTYKKIGHYRRFDIWEP